MYDTFSVINPALIPDYRMQIDWYGGLRVWDASGNWAGYPLDWVGVTLTAHAPTDTSYSVAQGDARSVYVIGGNAAGTALFPDGSGIPGPTAVINDSTILTYGGAFSAAASYFKANGVLASGTVVSDEWDTRRAPGRARCRKGAAMIGVLVWTFVAVTRRLARRRGSSCPRRSTRYPRRSTTAGRSDGLSHTDHV